MSTDTERVRGYAVVLSDVAITSSRSVCVGDCTFTTEGVFQTVDHEFVAEVVTPLTVSAPIDATRPPTTAKASALGGGVAVSLFRRAP